MTELANIDIFNQLQAAQNARIGMPSGMGVFNDDTALENARFGLNGREIKLEQMVDDHPYKPRLERIDAIEENVAQIVEQFVKKSNSPNSEFDEAINRTVRDGSFQATIRGLADEFQEEATSLLKELNIEAKPESPVLMAVLGN